MSTNTGLKTYTGKERNMYLTGLLGQNILYNVTNVLLVSYFLQNVLYIPAVIVSIIIAIARVWDAFNDPIMGTIVDKTRTKWGKCRPYLIFVPGIVMIISILCFVNVEYAGEAKDILEGTNLFCVIWAGFTYILWGMSYTAGDIPLWGITALMTEDEKHKQKLMSLARMAAGVGGRRCCNACTFTLCRNGYGSYERKCKKGLFCNSSCCNSYRCSAFPVCRNRHT